MRDYGTARVESWSVAIGPAIHLRDVGKDPLGPISKGSGTATFWERNLRFKTDSSQEGPDKDAPAIVNAGMMGDRASIIFSSPEEISRFIIRGC
jgi:cytochrome c